jgi:hypothetical protein
MLNIKSSSMRDEVLTVVYEAWNQAPNAGSILELDIEISKNLTIANGKTRFKAVLAEDVTGDAEAALDKLADWAGRLAIAIRHRGPATSVLPTFPSPVRPKPPTQPADPAAGPADEEEQ